MFVIMHLGQSNPCERMDIPSISGSSAKAVANRIGISPGAFYNKRNSYHGIQQSWFNNQGVTRSNLIKQFGLVAFSIKF